MKSHTKKTLQSYWIAAKKYKILLIVVVISQLATVFFSTFTPLYYKKFFDLIVTDGVKEVSPLWSVVYWILLLNVLQWLVWRIYGFTIAHMNSNIMRDLYNRSFEYLHDHSYRFFTNNFSGALVKKVNRYVYAYLSLSEKFIFDISNLALKVIAMIVVLYFYNALFAYIILVWVVLYVLLNYYLSIYKLQYDIQRSESDSRVTGVLSDTITNHINIDLFAGHKKEYRYFDNVVTKKRDITRKTWFIGNYIEAFQVSLMVLLEFAIFYFAAKYYIQGVITVGDIVLIQSYFASILHQIWGFGRVIRDIYENLADAEEMTLIFEEPHEVVDKPAAKNLIVRKGAVEFKDVHFNYHETRNIIPKFSFEIHAGEKIAIIGPSGGGKSTLVKLLLRFFDVMDGGIYIDGKNISDVTLESLRKNISFVPQDPILFHRTLLENIAYGRPGASRKDIIRASKLAHCHEFIKDLPDQYDTYVGERGIKLSGGERQRVAIARALLRDARILVLDEATSSLDSHTERLIQDALENLMKNKTTIVIAHRLSTIARMDRIVVIEKGKITEKGTHEELLHKDKGLYKKLWSLQAEGFLL